MAAADRLASRLTYRLPSWLLTKIRLPTLMAVAWRARIIAAAVARAQEAKDTTVRLHMEEPAEEEEAVVAE